jgi:hypothetical protein
MADPKKCPIFTMVAALAALSQRKPMIMTAMSPCFKEVCGLYSTENEQCGLISLDCVYEEEGSIQFESA